MTEQELFILLDKINITLPYGFKVRGYINLDGIQIRCHDNESKYFVPVTIFSYDRPQAEIIDMVTIAMKKLPRYARIIRKKNTKLGRILYK